VRLRALQAPEAARIHQAALRLLAEVGMAVRDRDTRALLLGAGCRETGEGRLLLPPALVAGALSSVPPSLVLYDREGAVAVDTAAAEACFSPGLNCINVLHWRSGAHRPCTLRDIEETARLCDRLPNIRLAAGLGNPSDLPPAEQAPATVQALGRLTRKPLAFIAHDEAEAEGIWGYLAELAGGWEALAARPFALELTGPYSPLGLGEEACRRLRFAARRRLPVVCFPAMLTGAAGPATLAGALAQSSAEILAGLVVHQLEGPGAPVISGLAIMPMDLRTGTVAYGSPEYVLACLGAADYFEELGVPTWVGAGCSDAHTVDAQAAAEAGMNMLAAAAGGTAFVHNLGFLSGGRTGSLEMLLLCDELAAAVRAVIRGIAVDEDTLAVEVARRALRDQSFLMDEHTLAHMRVAMWQPGLFARTTLPEWQAAGAVELRTRLRLRLQELLGDTPGGTR
jgi:trimethylamine--corrinoid protein Co-methyltransferase